MRTLQHYFGGLALILMLIIMGGCVGFKPYSPEKRQISMNDRVAVLQTMLDESINEFRLPGIQAGILQHGQPAILAVSGTIDWEHRLAPIGLHDSFHIGSTTKMFVAALVCRMAENHQLQLDASIDHWFPDFPQADSISVHDLLNQTSGIGESLFTDLGILIQSMLNPRKNWDPASLLADWSRKTKPGAKANRHFVYSNNNYVLLGLIAEKVGAASLASLLEREFFEPLGMQDTCLLPWSVRLQAGPIPGYDEFIPFGPHLIAADQISWDSLTFSAGAMSSSAHDLLIWLDALFHGKIVSRESWAMMRTWVDARKNGRDNNIVGYGLGIAQYELSGKLLEGHPGGGFGGECFPFFDRETDTTYVVVYNHSRKDNPAGKAILGRLLQDSSITKQDLGRD